MHDFLSIYFIVLIIITALPVLIYSIGYMEEYKENYSIKYFWAMLLLFIFSMIGVAISPNAISFIIFWELMSSSSFFLVIFEYKKSENIRSGIMYFIMTHISGILIMVMFIFMGKFTGSLDFNTAASLAPMVNEKEKWTILLIAFAGFGAKAGLVPLHGWLPKAHPCAPSNVSALMSGVMLKIALYGFIRIYLMFSDNISFYFGVIVMITGAVTAAFGIINALFQSDIKKLLAYSSTENIGLIFCTLGLGFVLKALGQDILGWAAITAALFHTLNHAVFKSLLFMGAGSIIHSTSTKNMNELGGLYNKLKFTGICVFIGTAAIAAIPPLNGFAGEVLILSSFIRAAVSVTNGGITLIIIFWGIILALTSGGVVWAFVKSYGTVFLGEPRTPRSAAPKSVPASMNKGMSILAAAAVLLGVFSPLVINFIFMNISKISSMNLVDYEITYISGMLLLIGIVTYILCRQKAKGHAAVSDETWGCGFNRFKPYIQYSSEGHVQPGARMLGAIAGYRKDVRIKETVYLKVRTRDIIESNIYIRVIRLVNLIASRIIKIHYGKIQIYVSYIFISLIISIVLVIRFI